MLFSGSDGIVAELQLWVDLPGDDELVLDHIFSW